MGENAPMTPLTPTQQEILALLAEGHSHTYAALQTGVHRNTIRNWRRTVPAFAREAEQALLEQALTWRERAIDLAPQASAVLHDLLHDPAAAPALKLRAALAVLKMAAAPNVPPLRPHSLEALEEEQAQEDSAARRSRSTPVVQPAQIEFDAQSCTIAPIRKPVEPGRNSTCPCGSGQKYKRCCASSAPGATNTQAAAA